MVISGENTKRVHHSVSNVETKIILRFKNRGNLKQEIGYTGDRQRGNLTLSGVRAMSEV